MTNQYPDNPDGSSMNAMGRWDYGMWFWPPMTLGAPGTGALVHGSVPCGTAADTGSDLPRLPDDAASCYQQYGQREHSVSDSRKPSWILPSSMAQPIPQ